MTAPHWVVTVLTVFVLAPWFPLFMMSPMMFGAPGASDNRSAILSVILILYYPLLVFLFYWIMKWTFFSFSPAKLLLVSTVVITAAIYFFGYFQLYKKTLSGIKSDGYSAVEDKVYYSAELLSNVDAATFELLDKDLYGGQTCFIKFAKDKNHVYLEGKIIEDAHSESFKRVLDIDKSFTRFFSDKNHAYTTEGYKIPSSDGPTFSSIGGVYFKDKNTVYYRETPIKGIRPEGSEVADGDYMITSESVYKYGELIPGVNIKHYRKLNYRFFVDDKNAFYEGKKITSNANLSELKNIKTEFHTDSFYADDKQVYYVTDQKLEVLENLNPESVKMLDRFYIQQDSKIYYFSVKDSRPHLMVTKASPIGFKVMSFQQDTKYDAKDDENYFLEGQVYKK